MRNGTGSVVSPEPRGASSPRRPLILTLIGMSYACMGLLLLLPLWVAPTRAAFVALGVAIAACFSAALGVFMRDGIGRAAVWCFVILNLPIFPIGTAVGIALAIYLWKPLARALFDPTVQWTEEDLDGLKRLNRAWLPLTVILGLCVAMVVVMLLAFSLLYLPAPEALGRDA